MPYLLENVFTAEAVHSWSPIVRTAWAERRTNPDGYLRALPPPGQRLATGPWSPQEEALFGSRIAEFRHHKWPLTYWGIFSLALPHRTGSQCRHFYRQSQWFLPNEETASIPLSANRACLTHHKTALASLFSSEIAQQVQSRVDAWLLQGKTACHIQTPSSSLTTSFKSGVNFMASLPPRRSEWAPPPPLPFQKSQPRGKRQKLNNASSSEQLPHPKRPSQKGFNGGSASAVAVGSILGQRVQKAADSDGSEDEFVAGSLRKVKIIKKPASSKTASSSTEAGLKSSSGGPSIVNRRGKGGGLLRQKAVPRGGLAASTDDFGDAELESERITILRFDKTTKLPGWARSVRPYAPKPPQNLEAVPTANCSNRPLSSSVIYTPSVLSFPFKTLGKGIITGVIINAPLSDDPSTGVTATQLSMLPLHDCLAADAIVCMWASKGHVAEAVGCMSKAWGCKYVENLTWMHLAPNGDVSRAPAPLTRASHSTLLMARRGGGELELRHQRNPDVIVEPAMGGGRFPNVVREMLETLLPAVKKGNGADSYKISEEVGDDGGISGGDALGSAPRFLEVAFHGAEWGERSGWIKLVQQ